MVNLWRNREIRKYIIVVAALGLVGLSACFLIDMIAGVVAAILFASVVFLSLFFTKRRYDEIATLSDALPKIATGDYSVDLRQYSEGELSILRDELYKVTRTLSHQAEALQKDKQYLADMMADISHQLKTPLTSVSMMTELLASANPAEEKRLEFIGNIRTSCERIRWLIMSLLKLSRLDAQAVELKREPVLIEALIRRVTEALRVPIELKDLILEEDIEDISITGDMDWLLEAIGNLLKNAVEHTPKGGQITIKCAANPINTLLEISNSGPGIPADELPYLFDRFFRGKNSTPDSIGIGLALTKSIIQRHGGTIEAKSESDNDTRFIIKFYKVAY